MAREKKEERDKRERRKPRPLELIGEVLSPKVLKRKKFLWQEIVAAMNEITRKRTKENEAALVKLLEFDGRIQLDPKSDIPGFMAPEHMLQYMAIQTLRRWTGRKYLKVYKKIYTATESPDLSKMARIQIEKLGIDIGEINR